MLTIRQIETAVAAIAKRYPVKRVQLFGSYAEGRETEQSDVDILVEFASDPISLLIFFGFQQELADALGKSVDIVKWPLSADTAQTLQIDRMVTVYGA